MKRFTIETQVIAARGTQTWWVEAETPDAALKAFHAGLANFVQKDVEVTESCDPRIVDTQEVLT